MEDFEILFNRAKELGHTVEMFAPIKSGKEASVFRALFDGDLVAMKVYKNPEERSFQHSDAYLAGKFYKSASERRAVAKRNAFGRKLKQENWIKREFSLLQKLDFAGAKIPRPIFQFDNVILMELLGDNEVVAKRLIDVDLKDQDVGSIFSSIIESMKIFWDFGIVHGDLSPYNILWWKSTPYVIDFPQAIDARTHPDVKAFLDRDLRNVIQYFSKYLEIDSEEVANRFRSLNASEHF